MEAKTQEIFAEAAIFTSGPFLLVKWSATPTAKALHQLKDAALSMYQRTNNPLVFVVLVGEEIKPPSPEVRQEFKSLLAALGAGLDAVHLVIEGESLKQGLKRIIAAAVILSSTVGHKISVHNDLKSVKAKLPAQELKSFEALLRQRQLA